jgi:hypothetical protein
MREHAGRRRGLAEASVGALSLVLSPGTSRPVASFTCSQKETEMKSSLKLSVGVAIFSAIVSASVFSFATPMAGFRRVDTGLGSGNYGGGGEGCLVAGSGNFGGSNVWVCPTHDDDFIQSFNSLTAFFTNSNPTQPGLACVAFFSQVGGNCTSTAPNNCPNRGVCSFNVPLNSWFTFPSHFKFVEFDNMSVGALMAGYTLNVTERI